MSADTVVERGRLDIAKVLGSTFQVIGRNFLTFAVLSLVLSGIPTGVIAYLQGSWLGSQDLTSVVFSPGYFTNLALGGIAAIVTTSILQGALIYATVQDMNGQKPQIGEALATGLRAFLPLFVVSILFAIAIMFGLILLIVPGIMIGCAWCVAVPALVAERRGIFDSFSRASDLTRGHRWGIFGLFVLIWIIMVVVSMVLGSITAAAIFSTPGVLENPAAAALNPVSILIQVIQQTITAVISASLIAVLYVELRKIREGAGPQWLAEIFS